MSGYPYKYTLAIQRLDCDELTINLILGVNMGEVGLKDVKFDPNKKYNFILGLDRSLSNDKLYEPVSSTSVTFETEHDLWQYIVDNQDIFHDLHENFINEGYNFTWVIIASYDDKPISITSPGWGGMSKMIKDGITFIKGKVYCVCRWEQLDWLIADQEINKICDGIIYDITGNFKKLQYNYPDLIIRFDSHCGYLELPIKDLNFSTSTKGKTRFIISERTK